MNPRNMSMDGIYICWVVELDGNIKLPEVCKAPTPAQAAEGFYKRNCHDCKPYMVHVVDVMDGDVYDVTATPHAIRQE